jgi:CRISPR/Cas system CSM-associated protein Csm3 (group 7 of RAMP superfamily)
MQVNLEFIIQSYWHIGTGHEGGAYADALTLKDEQKLPYLPGKSIKGLLRYAFDRSIANHWVPKQLSNDIDMLDLLFGQENTQGNNKQGLLQISSACLTENEVHFLEQNKQAKSMLYKVTYATAIESNTGVAKDGSLRSTEVTIPMTLIANLSLNSKHPSYQKIEPQLNENFLNWLELALSLITEIGAKRHRGLGKVIVTATPIAGVQ